MITFTNYANAVIHQARNGGQFVTVSSIDTKQDTDQCEQLHIWTDKVMIVDVYNKETADTELFHSLEKEA